MKYTIKSAITIGPGHVLGLTDDQAAVRKHALRAKGKGNYEVIAPVQFKAGEVIHTDSELPKALAESLDAAPRKKKSGANGGEPSSGSGGAESDGTSGEPSGGDAVEPNE